MPPTCLDALPNMQFDDCNPEFLGGEIVEIWLGIRGQAFTALYTPVTGATEVTTRLASATSTRIELLTVIGDKPAPEQTEQSYSAGRKKVVSRSHTVNFEIDEINDTNYTGMRLIQGGGGQFQAWYLTADRKHVYGGNKGIAVSVTVSEVIPRERSGKFLIVGTLRWEDVQSPIRGINPLYEAAT